VLGFSNLKLVQKICLAGIFAALAMIFNKVFAINYLPAVPFVRISFGGPAIIIFASFFLGPIFGACVGGLSDFLGYLIFDIRQFAYSPTITITYILLGLLPYFIFKLIKKVNNKKAMALITFIPMLALAIFVSVYLIFNNSFSWWGKTYEIALWMKIVFPSISFILLALVFIGTIVIEKKRKKEVVFNTYQVSFSCFILEVLVMTLFGSLMKSIMPFSIDLFPLILFFQSLTLFFNVFINTFVINTILPLVKKYIN